MVAEGVLLIAIGGFLTNTSRRSDVVLPPTLAGERSGTITNLEGRVQGVNQKVAAQGATQTAARVSVKHERGHVGRRSA